MAMAMAMATVLDDIVQQLLQALPGDAPAGRWMRYEREFMEIPKLREEDDPSLPMGEWERPIVKADWRKVADACVQLMRNHTKDFQLAGWLCDAWIRTARMDGLCAGLLLTSGLAERYWGDAWPAIEDGDTDRRVAPFVWMNANLPMTLRLNVVLLPTALHRAKAVTLLDWERAPTADDAKSGDGQPLSRREIRDSVQPSDGNGLRELSRHASEGLATLQALGGCLDDKLGQDSPSLSKIAATLEAARMAADSLLQELPAPVEVPVEAPVADVPVAEAVAAVAKDGESAGPSLESLESLESLGQSLGQQSLQSLGQSLGQSLESLGQPLSFQSQALENKAGVLQNSPQNKAGVPQNAQNALRSREQAYETLMAVATYLQAIEPHSPTPYLVQRAVALGQMGLPQMVKEVSASAGSLDKFFELLGIAPPN